MSDKKPIPQGMHTETVDSLGIKDLIEAAVYNSVEDIDRDGGPGTACNLANAYCRQKEALVDGRNAIVSKLITLTGFGWDPTKTKKRVVGGKDVVVNTETEGAWIARFKPAALAGKVAINGKKYDNEAALDQAIIDISRELGPFIVSAKKAVREAKAPPDYALNGADAIIANGSQSKWVETFTKGDKLAGPVAFNTFVATPSPGATPEVAAQVREANRLNLAWAIKAREDDKRARAAKKEYV
jgi:hypothetical protein